MRSCSAAQHFLSLHTFKNNLTFQATFMITLSEKVLFFKSDNRVHEHLIIVGIEVGL